MTQNISLPFSVTTNGLPIPITTTASPGTLIHTASLTEKDFVWLYLSLDVYKPYLDEPVLVKLIKGTAALGYTTDSVIRINSGQKTPVETGLLLTGGLELRVFNYNNTVPLDYTVIATGYIHRRFET
jgi:hypothetical protein